MSKTVLSKDENGLRRMAELTTRSVRARGENGVHIVKEMKGGAGMQSGMRLICEGTTGRQMVGLPKLVEQHRPVSGDAANNRLKLVPRIWAVEDASAPDVAGRESVAVAKAKTATLLEPEVAFYRKYTEALLRRYLRMSTEAGRVPSFMGRELFRGNVTSYKVRSFEDVVIFCHDVEKCLKALSERELELIKRVTLQSYTKAEAASMLGISLRWCVVSYEQAIDKLTHELMRLELLNPMKGCQ